MSDKSSSILAVHSRDLVGDLSQVIAKAAQPEQVSELKVVLPSLKFVIALMDLDTDNEAVNIVTDAWSIGLTTSLMVHQNLLPLLSAQKLQQLPITITDHKGFSVYTLNQSTIGYGDVALLENGWLLAENVKVVTSLAVEYMQKNDLHMVKN